MSKQRKFNARSLFDAFHGHEEELVPMYSHFAIPVPHPLTTESAHLAASAKDLPAANGFTAFLHQIHDLNTQRGREIVEDAAASFAVNGPPPGEEATHARVALWLWNADKLAFDNALDRLAASGVQGGKISLFPGKSAMKIADPGVAVAGFGLELGALLKDETATTGFNLRHYLDGNTLVFLVFCERTAEVEWELDRSPGAESIKTRIRRPVIQDVLFYDQNTGELEIEASRPKQRELLRSAFASGVLDDDSFFPAEESSRVLTLLKLKERGFVLPTRQGHCASITGITLKIPVGTKQLSADFSANRHDVVAALRGMDAQGLLASAIIRKVRIELVLGQGRLDRKSIELSSPNGIKFNRASHVDTVFEYLRVWSLMEQGHVEGQSAA